LGIVFSFGCGGGSSSSDTAQLRVFLGATGAPSVNILVDGATVATNLGYGSATAYLTVKTGSRHVQATPVAGGSPILDTTISISSSAHQTMLITGSSTSVQSTVLTDGGTTAVSGDGHVRVFNASSTMVASDVYIVPAGTSLIGAMPVTTTPLGFNGNIDYQPIPAGNYEIFMTVPTTTTVNLGTGPLNVAASANQTVVAFDAAGGGFTYILFTDQ
jgi:hypothetical protein